MATGTVKQALEQDADMLSRMPSEREIADGKLAELGKRIRRLREHVPGRTQAEFGRLFDVTHVAVGNWENGKGIGRKNLDKVAQTMGVSVDWLINGPDDGPIPFIEGEQAEPPSATHNVLSVAIDEALRTAGVSDLAAEEIVAEILRVCASNLPGSKWMSAEETTRLD